ncbi:MAG: hypothetical protein K6T74_02670, partial [Geminicoccaceae bacterium]|nr:hypothetical protein [Geminicoccaceae bacterium]
ARTEPTLRDMLQQFRHLFDHIVFDAAEPAVPVNPLPIEQLPPLVKSAIVVESAPDACALAAAPLPNLTELWDQEMKAARAKLEHWQGNQDV